MGILSRYFGWLQKGNPAGEVEKYPEVTKRNYEEIIETCNLLQEETVSSIENWTDIVPEADIKTLVGIISELKSKLSKTENELSGYQQQLQAIEGKSGQERERLVEEIKKKEKQIDKLTNEITQRRAGLVDLGLAAGIDTRGIRTVSGTTTSLGLSRHARVKNFSTNSNFGLGNKPPQNEEPESN